MSKLLSPKAKPLFKSRSEVIQDPVFINSLKKQAELWSNVRKNTGLDVLYWWEEIVKPSIRKLIIERSRHLSKEKFGKLNLLQIRQSYLVRKLQSGCFDKLTELNYVQSQIVQWHKEACEKVKIQSKCDEINSAENVRLFHHELHKK